MVVRAEIINPIPIPNPDNKIKYTGKSKIVEFNFISAPAYIVMKYTIINIINCTLNFNRLDKIIEKGITNLGKYTLPKIPLLS